MSARHVFVSGLVQGVGFRAHVRRAALARGVRGWVKNRPNGQVEAWLEGDPTELESVLGDIRAGPPGARVEAVEVSEVDPEGHEGFVQRA